MGLTWSSLIFLCSPVLRASSASSLELVLQISSSFLQRETSRLTESNLNRESKLVLFKMSEVWFYDRILKYLPCSVMFFFCCCFELQTIANIVWQGELNNRFCIICWKTWRSQWVWMPNETALVPWKKYYCCHWCVHFVSVCSCLQFIVAAR